MEKGDWGLTSGEAGWFTICMETINQGLEMVCPNCDGKRYFEEKKGTYGYVCDHCDGRGKRLTPLGKAILMLVEERMEGIGDSRLKITKPDPYLWR